MKLVPDSVSSRLGKLLPGGASNDDRSEDAAPASTAPSNPSPEPQTPAHDEATSEQPTEHEDENQATAHENENAGENDGNENEPSAEAGSSSSKDSESSSDGADDDLDDASNITAPSIGPNTVIEHEPPEERLDFDKISDEDAMGNDKRREVVGKRYSASPARQLVTYALFIVVVVALFIGGKALATKLDEPPKTVQAQAPWTGTERPVQRLDFPQYGKPAS